jgi:hypothetical protein
MNPQPAALRLVEPAPDTSTVANAPILSAVKNTTARDRSRPVGRVVARVTFSFHRDASGVVSRDVVIEKTS